MIKFYKILQVLKVAVLKILLKLLVSDKQQRLKITLTVTKR